MAARTDKERTKERQGNGHESTRSGLPVPFQHERLAPSNNWELSRGLRDEFDRMFDRMFDQFFRGWPTVAERSGNDRRWGLNIHEVDNAVVVRAEAPGFEPDDFDLEVRGDQLILRAGHKAESEDKERGQREWRQQELYRSLFLPSGVAAEKAEAHYRNGVLTVKLPKTEESKGRRIPIQG
jgi:HSP20 family protein